MEFGENFICVFLPSFFCLTENVCDRMWTFERVPNKLLRGYDTAQLFTSTKEACLASCLNEVSNVIFPLGYDNIQYQVLSKTTEQLLHLWRKSIDPTFTY